jgi:hypothetical protein
MRDWEGKGATMSSESDTESAAKADTVVSVRFAADEVAALKRLADAQKIPLSTLIRRIALSALDWTPPIARFGSNNEASTASGWVTYEAADPRSGSRTDATSVAISYSSRGHS